MPRGYVALVALAACASPAAVRPAPPRITGSISGRVTIDGAPVTSFAVAIVHGHVDDVIDPVRAPDGRFHFDVPPGAWTVVIAGDGFARAVREASVVTGGDVHLDIAVERGARVEGIVRDTAGAPVAGAYVRVSQLAERPSAAHLIDLARGTASAITDGAGRFRLDDVAIERFTSIEAAAPAAVARRRLATDEHRVELTLLPVGSIRGVIEGAQPTYAYSDRPPPLVIATSVDGTHRAVAVLARDGTFVFESIPAGEYVLPAYSVHVVVEASRATLVTIPSK